MTGNSECECLKILQIGQSAAKLPGNRSKVQRLAYGFQTGSAEEGKMQTARDKEIFFEDIVHASMKVGD